MNEVPQETEKKNYSRLVFLNLLICLFIIISYVYFAEAFGSISTVFLESQEFILRFGITLVLFTFLSVLAGSLQGLISGFLAELLYQVAFYHEIYLEWCLIVAILGFLVGLYKYKPLKFHEGIKIFYTFLMVIICSVIMTGIIIIFQTLFHPNQFPLDIVVLNFGLKFFLQALISIVFIVPLLLVLYDKILATEENDLYYMILTHHPTSASDHTFYLKFGRTKIYFCSRCSGVILGGLFAVFATHMLELVFQTEFNGELALLLIIILPIPGIVDWGTQRLLLRKSTTGSRIFTGFIIGNALHFMSFTYKYYFFTFMILIIYFSIIGALIYFGHKKEMKLLRMEDYPYLDEEEDE
ncbi:MAG: DUF2085 domain-containing protein [Candidatus Lokiarchaeota archaeon]|nr:DUF2085 domain-containing protein [Candidatus Lokiarchaeota archaeon]